MALPLLPCFRSVSGLKLRISVARRMIEWIEPDDTATFVPNHSITLHTSSTCAWRLRKLQTIHLKAVDPAVYPTSRIQASRHLLLVFAASETFQYPLLPHASTISSSVALESHRLSNSHSQ